MPKSEPLNAIQSPVSASRVKPDFVGVFDLFDEIPEALRRAHGATARVERGGEAVNTQSAWRFATFISWAGR